MHMSMRSYACVLKTRSLISSLMSGQVMSNQEAVDSIKNIKDAELAAKHLIDEAINRNSKDDISCIVVKLQ